MGKPVVGITMGDPAGIGPEICAKALNSPEIQKIAGSVVIGDRKSLRQGIRVAKLPGIEINPIKHISEAKFTPGIIDLIDLNNVDQTRVKTGQISKAAGRASVEYIEKAIA